MTTVETAGRLLVSLAVVLGVIWLIARRARKGGRGRGTRVIEVLDRASLSRGSSVAVVRVHDRAFVLGIAEAQVSLLGETDLDAAAPARHTVADEDTIPVRRPAIGRPRSTDTTRPASTAAGRTTWSATPTTSPRPISNTTAAGGTADSSAATAPTATHAGGSLTGSALSSQTWKQTLEALRDLTARP